MRQKQVMRPKLSASLYFEISLSKDSTSESVRVHRIVAEAFIPNPENKPCVDHINRVTWDNRVENLRWCTWAENSNYRFDRGMLVDEEVVIQQFDLSGNLIKEYACIQDVDKHGYKSRVVNKAVLGQRKTAYGHQWKRITRKINADIENKSIT